MTIPRATGFLVQASRAKIPFSRRSLSTVVDPSSFAFGVVRGGSLSNRNDNNNEDDDSESEFPLPPFVPPPLLGNNNGKGVNKPPDKGDLYSNDELWDLLQLHEGLNEKMMERQSTTTSESVVLPGEQIPEAGIPSLHDLVMQTVQEVDGKPSKDETTETDGDDAAELIRGKVKDIIAIASDVDGTLLTSRHELHPRTERAIRQAVQEVKSFGDGNGKGKLQYFFPATGKTRKGALDSLGPEIKELLSQLPGVFIQGLYCIDSNGSVLFEQKLTPEAIQKAEVLGKTHGVTLLGYDGDNLYSNSVGDPELCAEIHEKWGEPMPQSIQSLAAHSNGLHKILLMHQDVNKLANEVRPDLQELADGTDASVTQAIPTMLELLPRGCSKALGVEKLCQALGVDPRKQLLAIGDAENDIGMLEMAAIGVAVNNACEIVKEAADVVLEESNDEGGAGAAMEKFSPLAK